MSRRRDVALTGTIGTVLLIIGLKTILQGSITLPRSLSTSDTTVMGSQAALSSWLFITSGGIFCLVAIAIAIKRE